MSNERCRFGYTERSCAEKDYPPCNSNCELSDKSLSQKSLKRF